MKKTTLSLTTALLMGTSAFALETKIDNVKLEGDAKLYYSTSNGGTNSLFNQGKAADAATESKISMADAALRLKLTADLNKNLKTGVSTTTLSTLGLENNLVRNTFSDAHPGSGVVDDFTLVTESWVALNSGKTTVKLGRQLLDTPLVFSENWSVLPNSYDATVILNKSIPDVTLIGAYVGKGNGGTGKFGHGTTTQKGEFGAFGADSNKSKNSGAYALAAVYSKNDLKVQAWAYNVADQADALWIEAEKSEGLIAGVQYTTVDYKAANSTTDSNAVAAKVGVSKKDAYSLTVAYSETAKEGTAGFNVGGGKQSKLYTETKWNYGYVTRKDTTAVNVTAKYDVSKTFSAAIFVTQTDSVAVNTDMMETTLRLTKKYDDFKASLVYIGTDAEDQNSGVAFDTVQLYLTASF